ncbi:hypothetical protein KC343_g10467 [Hortaea werneckii]|uniref:Peptidase M48 domain-containing protein n=2 Tax=Hortaea werneckii TaxID=91943 RepID=A0A3M7ENK6_HORWE|nr:hypothetical protein KC317_g4795 [Hortaea werneckii]KAI7611530.1 hypothetical protein KC346_g8236 [Hortaea werneckii]KAI7614524.1 hypothetical protein KC343_g10467 [Hortaea werneckii]KAI7657812.1 hypothetical protein KC319_g9410 [Hortaea werneckii]KAI7710127.1 hypothetical protein KC322_g4484 [Hortaea werneckii]
MSPTRVLALTTGLLSLTNSDDELAVVVGHELAHAIAGHSREENLAGKHERLLLLPWLPMVIPGQTIAWLSASISPIFHLPAFVLTSPAQALVYWTLRRSRAQEREADYIGLVLMCEAGYDPAAAITHWVEMEAREQEQIARLQAKHGRGNVRRINEWASTHPHSTTRIAEIETLIPQARAMVEQGKRLQQEGNLSPTDAAQSDDRSIASWLTFLRRREEGAREMAPLQMGTMGFRVQCLEG